MIVVSDTGPIHYLLLIEREFLLPKLFNAVILPQAVIDELTAVGTPQLVKRWVNALPDWVNVMNPTPIGDASDGRGRGERAAIALAKELNAPLLCDDRQASAAARREGILVSGTLGVLKEAHVLGLDDIREATAKLEQTNYRVTKELVKQVVASALEMREQQNNRDKLGSDS